MKRAVFPVVLVLLMLAGLGWYLQREPPLPPPPSELLVRGGDGGGLPHATAADESMSGPAVDEALARALQQQAQAVLVMRHGHLVAEAYAPGFDRNSRADAGAFAATLVAMNVGIVLTEGRMHAANLQSFQPERLAAILASESDMAYQDYLSTRLWRPLNAADASYSLARPGAAVVTGCCLTARIVDWLRVAEVLLADGSFEGEAVLPQGWVTRMRQPLLDNAHRGLGVYLASAAVGAEPLIDGETFFLRGGGRWRLWMVPSLHLAVLHAGPGSSDNWDETELPNALIRAVLDRSARNTGNTLQQLVPGH